MEMTANEARFFVRRWRRVLIPWPTPHTDAQAAKVLEYSLSGMAFGPIPALLIGFLSSPNKVKTVLSSGWTMGVIVALIGVMVVANRLRIQCAQARAVLESAG